MESILMENLSEPAFEPLPMRRRTIEPVAPNMYRIISSRGDTKQLQALTAYEAFRQSGFSQAIKIERMVNIRHDIVGNEKFIDHMSFKFKQPVADITTEKEDPVLAIKRRTIVSADELDSLIKEIQQGAHAQANANLLVETIVPVLQTFDEGLMPGPTGLDVHGDGFDEIIPGNMARTPGVKPLEIADMPFIAMPADEPEPEAKASETEQLAAPAALEPQRELSAAEIEGLLSGNLPDAS